MTLADELAAVRDRRKTLVVYAPDDAPDVAGHFATRNVVVERRSLPAGGPGFVVVHDDGSFVGAFPLPALRTLLAPPLSRPWDADAVAEPWRSVFDVLGDALFAAFDRRQLLATAREIENRAWRGGRGGLRVGFQRAAALRDQAAVYRRLAAETDLDVHVFVDAGADPPALPGVSVHAVGAPEIGRFWFLVFEGDGHSALVAEETGDGSFDGFWTYDAARVTRLGEYLRRTYE